jgi:hypothetical protein
MNNMPRRRVLLGTSALLLAAMAPSGAQAAKRKRRVSKAQWMEKWMAEWRERGRTSDSPLYLGRFREPIYFLTSSITWKPNPDQAGNYQAVEVPAGFVTDLASVPSIFFSALRPDGEYTYAAIIHDYLYWTQTRPRNVADEIFKFSMTDYKIDTATAFTIYQTVSQLGGRAWDDNARLRAQGEKRVLKQYPPNARTSWADWKKVPDVFLP